MVNQIANRPNGAGAIMQQSELFDTLPDEWDDLTANVAISFPILGIKASKWHYRYRGEEQILLDAQGRFPTPAIQVVILKAQKELSRTYYANPWVEGVNNPPDCWSSNGVAPDETVAQPINPVCATCPCDAWGSGATPASPKAKACQQRRRTVVVPYSVDLTNEGGGGPILLSVPPGSLANQVTYGNKLRDNRIHYSSCVTELSFTQDPSIGFPKIEFNYVRPLTTEEAQVILRVREHEQVERILMTKMVPAEMDQTTNKEEAPATAPPRPAAQAQPRAPVTPRPSVVRPAAPPPPPPPPVNRVGGFAMQQTAAAKAPPPPPPPGTIAGAMATKAAPPPTQRVVQAAAPAEVVGVEETGEQDGDPAGEPEVTETAIPLDMNNLFTSLMKAG